MAPQDSQSEYAARMHRVLEHIDHHLDVPLQLETLAGVANFSPFHFHRLFSAWMGETLGEYLRRRRLEVGAQRLVTQPRQPVLEVAAAVGFGSTEAFARAFKTRFGKTPSEWRSAEHRNRNQSLRKSDQSMRKADQARATSPIDHEPMQNTSATTAMTVKLIDRQPTTIAYFRHVGPYGQPLSDFWEKTFFPWAVTNNLLGQPRFGISHDDPGITAPEKLRYDAAVEVSADFVGAGPHLKTTLPGGKYAAAQFKGTADDIGSAWESLLRDWLPGSGMQLDARPLFEYYSREAAYDPDTGVFECDLCIPVVAL